MTEKLLTIREVTEIVGFKKFTIYKFMNEGKFPKQVKIGKSSRWKMSEIKQWMEQITSV
jgi:prophage regulatory protein